LSFTAQGKCKDAVNDAKYGDVKNKIKELFTKAESDELYKWMLEEDKKIEDPLVMRCAVEEVTGKSCKDGRRNKPQYNKGFCHIPSKHFKIGDKDWYAEVDNWKCKEKEDPAKLGAFNEALDKQDFSGWPNVWQALGNRTAGIITECFLRRVEVWQCIS